MANPSRRLDTEVQRLRDELDELREENLALKRALVEAENILDGMLSRTHKLVEKARANDTRSQS